LFWSYLLTKSTLIYEGNTSKILGHDELLADHWCARKPFHELSVLLCRFECSKVFFSWINAGCQIEWTKLMNSYSIAVLIYYIKIFLVLANTDESYKLRMVPNFNWSHYLSFKLFFWSGWMNILFYLLYGDLTSSPLTLEDLRRISIAYFLFKY
jgi:hypothetical protein